MHSAACAACTGGASARPVPHIFPGLPPLAGRRGTATMGRMFASKKKKAAADAKDAPTEGAGPKRRARPGKGPSLETWLCWATMGLAGLLLLLFLLDLFARFP